MTSPRQWDDVPELSDAEQRDELVRQLRRQGGVIGVTIQDTVVQIMLDPTTGPPASPEDLISTVRQYQPSPITIEIATYLN